MISATKQPVLEAPRCMSTGLWLMPLDSDKGKENDSDIGEKSEKVSAIFELPSTRQTIMYHHASAGFPVKETFLCRTRSFQPGYIVGFRRV
jgi:hypothetical protein